MNVYFMRHGETDWNKVRRIQGSTDIPLNQNGIDMAEIVSRKIFESGITFDKIFSSNLQRAVKTAEIMNRYSNAPLEIDERIKEFVFGQAEGAVYEDLRTDPKYGSLKNWFLDPDNYHAELGAESYEEFFGRIEQFLDQRVKPLEKDEKLNNVLLVCHGGVVRGLLKVMCGWSINQFAKTKIPNCGLNLVTLKDGAFTVEYTAKIFDDSQKDF